MIELMRGLRFRTMAGAAVLSLLAGAGTARAQDPSPETTEGAPLGEVLSFLLTNQAVATGDFVKDAEAAAMAADAITRLLQAELTTLPLGSSSAGFTYRLNPAVGVMERSSDSFGPLFAERSLTAGRGRLSLGMTLQFTSYSKLDDVDLDSGTLVTVANQFRDEPQPFDAENLTLEVRSRTVTFLGTLGATDWLDLSVAVPVVSLTIEGQRINTYRGEQLLQATGIGEATGLGDMAIRAKARLYGARGTGLALIAETRLPTGREEDLLGSGEASFSAMLVGSYEPGRLALHGNVGLIRGGLVDEVGARAAVTFSPAARVTLLAEGVARNLTGIGRLRLESAPHPTIEGVDTFRLIRTGADLNTSAVNGGVRWNVAGAWLINAGATFPITNHGLRPGPTILVGLEYAFGG
jgi:hypothetical protein